MLQNIELYGTAKLNEKNKLWMKTVVACFQVMPQNLSGGSREKKAMENLT
jgi:hypothetical protein